MAGIEVLGALASISQLLEYGLKISSSITEACRRVNGAQSRLQNYNSQIRQLNDIALLIQQNEQLQTPVVRAQVDSTVLQARALLRTIQAVTADYTEGSRNKRYWKAARATKENQISAGFERLEQEKGALILCISVIQADTMSTISSNVNTMNRNVDALLASKNSRVKTSSRHSQEQKIVYPLENKSLAHVLKGNPDESKSLTLLREEFKASFPESKSANSYPSRDHSANKEEGSKRSTGVFQHKYIGARVTDNGDQLNGNNKSEDPGNNYYESNSAESGGQQINGDIGGTGKHSYLRLECSGENSLQINGNFGEKADMQHVRDIFKRR